MPFESLVLSLRKWEAARDLNPCSAVSLTRGFLRAELSLAPSGGSPTHSLWEPNLWS